MCSNAVSRFRCAPVHAVRLDGWRTLFDLKLSHIAKCDFARNNSLPTCVNRNTIEIINQDDSGKDCPECRGETPLETP